MCCDWQLGEEGKGKGKGQGRRAAVRPGDSGARGSRRRSYSSSSEKSRVTLKAKKKSQGGKDGAGDDGWTEPLRSSQPKLADGQRRTVQHVLAGKNVFCTGPAGCGKSFIIRRVVHDIVKGSSCRIAVTAATGIAAWNLAAPSIPLLGWGP